MVQFKISDKELRERNAARVKEAIQKLGTKYAHHPDNYVKKLAK